MKSSKASILTVVLLSLATPLFAQTTSTAPPAKPKVIHQDAFFVVGIEARTTAARETSAEGLIPQQWQKFMQEGVFQKIPNKADRNIYALYTDFANKRSGEYSVVIGARVTSPSQVPTGMVLKTVPAGKYAIFESDQGPAREVIPAAWQKVAGLEDQGKLGYPRAYRADYEVYDSQNFDPESLRAELHIGVK